MLNLGEEIVEGLASETITVSADRVWFKQWIVYV